MSNSSLISYTHITKHKNSPRNHKIDTITIHCMAGQMSAAGCADYFATTDRDVSSNYCIGYDGKIALSVDEKDRSWCSSFGTNDHRAITIEVASDENPPYAVKTAAYNSLIKLVTDICKRNGIAKLVWSNNASDRINHKNGCNMTCHRDFANKSCPGEYLYSRMGEIAAAVNKQLVPAAAPAKKETPAVIYRVRKNWNEPKTQTGAYTVYSNAVKEADSHPGYSVFDTNGKKLYTSKTVTDVAKEVIAGKWSTGVTRKLKLKAAGYDAAAVQKEVNRLLGI